LHSREARQYGFTLIELVVVMVIIAVGAMLITPAFQAGARQREVRRTLQQMQSIIRRASSTAILKRTRVKLRLRPEDGTLALAVNPKVEETGSSPAATHEAVTSGDDETADGDGFVVAQQLRLPLRASIGDVEGGRMEDHDRAIAFDFLPTGGSSGGRIELRFADEVGGVARQGYALVLDPLTSALRLEELR